MHWFWYVFKYGALHGQAIRFAGFYPKTPKFLKKFYWPKRRPKHNLAESSHCCSEFETLFFSTQISSELIAEKKNHFFVCVLDISHLFQAEKMSFSLFSDVEDHSLAFGAHKTIKMSKLTPPPPPPPHKSLTTSRRTGVVNFFFLFLFEPNFQCDSNFLILQYFNV